MIQGGCGCVASSARDTLGTADAVCCRGGGAIWCAVAVVVVWLRAVEKILRNLKIIVESWMEDRDEAVAGGVQRVEVDCVEATDDS